MTFLFILERIISLYFVVFLGYIGGKKLSIRKEELATLVVYLLTPLVVFSAIARAKLDLTHVLLPVLFLVLSVGLCLVGYKVASIWFDSPSKNILAFSAGQANSGYFAIPVGMAIFGEDSFSTIVFCSFGFILCEITIGYYLVARSNYSARNSLIKMIKMPAVYGFLFGIIANVFGLRWGNAVQETFINLRSTYSVLGMMIIGLAVANLTSWKPDIRFTSFALFMKYLVWPILIFMIIKCDTATIQIFDPLTRRIVFFMSTIPLAANSVAFATLLNAEPEKTAIAVLFSTLLALVIVPLLNGLALNWL